MRIPRTLVALVVAASILGPFSPVSAQPGSTRCTEDMACWDCSTMGNLICGPVES